MDKIIKLLDEITKEAFEKRIHYDDDVDSSKFNYWKGYHEAIGDIKKLLRDSKEDFIIFRQKNPMINYPIDYTKCIYLEQVDTSFTADNIEVPLYKCKKGHEICQKSMWDKPCDDFEIEGD